MGIEVHNNKSLRLDNVLIKQIFNTIEEDDVAENESEDFLEIVVEQMENQIKSKGAHSVGYLIQYSGWNMEMKR